VVDSSKHGAGLDSGAIRGRRRKRVVERGGAALVDALMRSCRVEIGAIVNENALEMEFAEQQNVIEAVAA